MTETPETPETPEPVDDRVRALLQRVAAAPGGRMAHGALVAAAAELGIDEDELAGLSERGLLDTEPGREQDDHVLTESGRRMSNIR